MMVKSSIRKALMHTVRCTRNIYGDLL